MLTLLTLYYAPGSCALASHISLEESGLPYIAKCIDFGRKEQQSQEYLAINPKGRVPALVTKRGILTETPAILAFIAQSAPVMQLASLDDPFAFAEMQAFNSYLCSTLHVAHAHRMRGRRWADDECAIEAMRRKVPETVATCFAYIEESYLHGPFVLGDHYTVADAYLFTVARWMEDDGVDPARFPRVREHRQMVAERPAVAAALRAEGLAC